MSSPKSRSWRDMLRAHVAAALAEDGARYDVTSSVSLPPGARGTAALVAGAAGRLAGVDAAAECFRVRSGALRVKTLARDGARLTAGQPVLRVTGRSGETLSAERCALNYLMHLSGIATLTARFVQRLEGTGVALLDTRKTLPLLRLLEKAAVRAGGGHNHRMGLFDAVLIKENHVSAAGGLPEAVARARAGLERRGLEHLLLEVEAHSLPEVSAARDLPVGRILLDNFTPAQVRRAMVLLVGRRARGRLEVEVSGGIHLENIRKYALPGVDYISVGALTHSAPALPFSLDWVK